MSEDAPVNTGAATPWPNVDMAWVAVRRMQTKLHRWALDDPERRFGDLANLVYDPAFLVHAWERVSTNKGARTAGIDRVTVARIESAIGVEAFLDHIRHLLKSGEFRPVEVRRVTIPKPGLSKVRQLGIPTVIDRVVQASLKAVLEPIFEADFKPCSYGFRPNRRAQDAIAEIHHLGTSGYHWVFESDIQRCFDEIDHTALMCRFRERVKDKRICAWVKAFLKAGVLAESGDREDTLTGTPQGGILSPLLANITLSRLDEHFDQRWYEEMGSFRQRANRRRQGAGNWKLIRYADLCGTQHKSAYVECRVMPTVVEGGLVDGWAVRVIVGITSVMIRGFPRLDGYQTPDGRGSWMRLVVSPVARWRPMRTRCARSWQRPDTRTPPRPMSCGRWTG